MPIQENASVDTVKYTITSAHKWLLSCYSQLKLSGGLDQLTVFIIS